MQPTQLTHFPFPLPSGILIPSGVLTSSGVRDWSILAPLRLSAADRAALLAVGFHKTRPFKVVPPFVDKQVHDPVCSICGQHFAQPQAVCHRCGNCVFCGAYNMDTMSNYCFVCGNNGGGRIDDDITTHAPIPDNFTTVNLK